MTDTAVSAPPTDIFAGVKEALAAAALELRAEADRRDAGAHQAPDAAEIARLLRETADRLEQQGAWLGVDRLVHELLTGLLSDALAASAGQRAAELTAQAIALKAIARQAPLWPGVAHRLGCAYGYDSLMALVRTSALAAAA